MGSMTTTDRLRALCAAAHTDNDQMWWSTDDLAGLLPGDSLNDAAYIAALDPATVLRLLDCADALRELVSYIDDHDWGSIPEGATGDRARTALAALDGAAR